MKIFGIVMFVGVAVAVLLLSIYKPHYNWDMIGYIASVKSFGETDSEEIRKFTYDQIKKSVPLDTYEELTNGYYRNTVSLDSQALKENIPFYQIRVVYNGMLYTLYKVGVPLVFATHIVSAVALVIALYILYLMSVMYLDKTVVFLVPILAVLFHILEIARSSGPDGLAFLAVVLAAFLYLTRRMTLFYVLLPIMIGIRTDLILFVVPLLCCVIVGEYRQRVSAGVCLVVSIITYWVIGYCCQNPGWATLMNFTMVAFVPYPLSDNLTWGLSQHLHAILLGTRYLVQKETFLLYAGAVLYGIHSIVNNTKVNQLFTLFRVESVVLLFVSISYVSLHFLAFPIVSDRFFAAHYLLGIFMVLRVSLHKKTGDIT